MNKDKSYAKCLKRTLWVGFAVVAAVHSISVAAAQSWVPASLPVMQWSGVASSADGVKLVASSVGGGGLSPVLYGSTNSGATWNLLLPPGPAWTGMALGSNWTCVACSRDGNTVMAAGPGGPLCVSTNFGGDWAVTNLHDAFNAVACSADGSALLAVASSGLGPSTLYTSHDFGITWAGQSDANWPFWTSATCSDAGDIMVAAGYGGVHVSTNSGTTWQPRGIPAAGSVACSADAGKLAVTDWSSSFYTSTNLGDIWVSSASVPNASWGNIACSSDGNTVIAIGSGHLIYKSTNFGEDWAPMEGPATNWFKVACSADGSRAIAAVGLPGGLVYVSQPAPALTTAFSNGCILTSWPTTALIYDLQHSSALTPGSWEDATNTTALVNGKYQAAIPCSEDNCFLRLKSH